MKKHVFFPPAHRSKNRSNAHFRIVSWQLWHGIIAVTAAVAHFHLFDRLSDTGRLTFDELRGTLQLQARPANVLVTALRAMGLLQLDPAWCD